MSAANYSSVFVLVDENTKLHCLPVLDKVISSYTVIETKSGEANKNMATCEIIWQQLIENKTLRVAMGNKAGIFAKQKFSTTKNLLKIGITKMILHTFLFTNQKLWNG